MDNIKDVVFQVMGQISMKNPEKTRDLEKIWDQLLDGKERAHTKMDGIKKETVFITVDSPAWLYQLKIKQRPLLKKIQTQIPQVQKICFKIGKIA